MSAPLGAKLDQINPKGPVPTILFILIEGVPLTLYRWK